MKQDRNCHNCGLPEEQIDDDNLIVYNDKIFCSEFCQAEKGGTLYD